MSGSSGDFSLSENDFKLEESEEGSWSVLVRPRILRPSILSPDQLRAVPLPHDFCETLITEFNTSLEEDIARDSTLLSSVWGQEGVTRVLPLLVSIGEQHLDKHTVNFQTTKKHRTERWYELISLRKMREGEDVSIEDPQKSALLDEVHSAIDDHLGLDPPGNIPEAGWRVYKDCLLTRARKDLNTLYDSIPGSSGAVTADIRFEDLYDPATPVSDDPLEYHGWTRVHISLHGQNEDVSIINSAVIELEKVQYPRPIRPRQ